jgi:hypothetical protein
MSLARDIADLGSVTSRLDTVGASSGALSNRNIIINGAMQIAQRSTAAHNEGNGYFALDRWYQEKTNQDQFTYSVEQVSDAPSGFSKSLRVTTSTAETALAADEFSRIYQAIEGNNLARVGFGTADAKPLSLSFWVKSSITGNWSASLYINDANVIYSQAYTINAANTWEYKTLSIPALTSAGPNIDNTQGAILNFGLFAGSNWNTATTVWTAYGGGPNLMGGQTANLGGTLNATWQITGVQLEIGSQSTDFEHRSFGDELLRCQRYTYVIAGDDDDMTGIMGYGESASNARFPFVYPVIMRTSPSFTLSGTCRAQGGTADGANFTSGLALINENTNHTGAALRVTGSSNLANDRGYNLQIKANGTTLTFDAEL